MDTATKTLETSMTFHFEVQRNQDYQWARWGDTPTYNADLEHLSQAIASENGVNIVEWLDLPSLGIANRYVRLEDGNVYSLFLGDDFLSLDLSKTHN